jgi:integrase
MARLTESRSVRLKLPTSGQAFEWCDEVKGFGVRLTPGARSYIVQGRYKGKKFRLTLGPVGTLSFEGPSHAPGARDLAIAALNAARRGDDPRGAIVKSKAANGDGPTLNDIWAAYQDAGYPKLRGTGRKRPTTIKADADRYAKHLAPSLGRQAVEAIDTAAVRRWLDGIKSDGQRNQCLVLAKSLLSFAAARGLAKPQTIALAAGKSKEVQNFYSAAELAKLDRAIVELIDEQPTRLLAYSALRLLLLTGARKSEVLSLRWTAVDLEHGVLALEHDKTSDNRRDILLKPAAVALLHKMPRTSSPFVFFGTSEAGHVRFVEKNFKASMERAGLRRVRIHDLRHSFASASIRSGNSLYVTGKLLGHRQATTTARYAHLEHSVSREALDRIDWSQPDE